ncbi:MAG: hypothetical protein AB8G17_00710 [Gammaproteobacteria bacterium]
MIEKPVDADNTGGVMNNLGACMGRKSDRNNQLLVAGGLIVWALSSVVTSYAVEGGASAMLAIIPPLLSLVVVACFMRFLRQTDEYVRMMQYHGLALGFGLSICAFGLMEAMARAGVGWAGRPDTASVMLISWAVGELYIAWRHR